MASRTSRSTMKRSADDMSTPASSKSKPQPQKRTKTGTKPGTASDSNKINLNGNEKPAEGLEIKEETGDIFDAPPSALITHACNCEGSWGAGIAKAFKDRYAKAYEKYANHCDEEGHSLLGKSLLIPPLDAAAPQKPDEDDEGFEDEGGQTESAAPKHFVGCLFTSRAFGRKRDKPARILEVSKPAMEDLLKQVQVWNAKAEDGEKVEEVRMCKINSGLFAVPWEKTKQVLEGIDVSESDVKVIKVVSPPD